MSAHGFCQSGSISLTIKKVPSADRHEDLDRLHGLTKLRSFTEKDGNFWLGQNTQKFYMREVAKKGNDGAWEFRPAASIAVGC